MKINYSDIIINLFMIIISSAFMLFISNYGLIDYNYYLNSENSMVIKILVFSSSTIAIYYMLGIPFFSYFKKANTVSFYLKPLDRFSRGCGSSLVWLLLMLNIFMIPMIAYFCFDLPLISFVILYILSALFGFSLAIESKLENSNIQISNSLSEELRSYFDDTISNYLPGILLISLILFPVEYYLESNELEIYTKLIIVMSLLVPIYMASRFLSRNLFTNFDLKKTKPEYTRYLLTIIPVISICLFQSWELYLSTNKELGTENLSVLLYILLFTGVIPTRLFYVYEPNVHMLNRIITIVCLVIYACNKFIII